jgi:UDP-N-acetylmuramoyl-tripeptide--D-alanyl-D-alanine ligase
MTDATPVLSGAEILKATGGVPLRGGGEWVCRGISTDTRTLREGNLFIALTGENFDGHDWLAVAAQNGAAGLLIRTDRSGRAAPRAEGPPVIGVPDTLQALGEIARDWRRRFPIPVVAITGSSGKTTTREMLTAIASRSRRLLATQGNLNNLIGLPQALLGLRPEHQLAVVEMGTSSPGEIARLAAIAEPGIGLITNIGPAHLEGLGSVEAVREEKGALFTAMNGHGTALLNHDDDEIMVLARRWQGSRITYGLTPGADVGARQIESAGIEGIRFILVSAGRTIPVRLPVPGRHNVVNALAAAAAAQVLGFGLKTIAAGLAAYHAVSGRLEIRPLGNGAFLIMDTYNANPASVREALRTLQELRGDGAAVVILGDMLELGQQAQALHEETGAVLAATGVDHLFLKGTLSRSIAAGAIREGFPAQRILFFEEPDTVVTCLKTYLGAADWILVKGSRKLKMEKVAEVIISAFDPKGETV